MEKNVGMFKACFGCGVCSAACSKRAIHMKLNEEGFYTPEVDNAKCVNCGICLKVCSFNHKENVIENEPLKSWAAWSNDSQVRRKCSSGGVGFEIAKYAIDNEYKVVGCRYNVEEQRAEHYIATTAEELVQSIGSKYLQSYTETAFQQVDRNQKYLVTGTPCQIDSFRRYARLFKCEDKFIFLDFFCHCVPSYYLWKTYMKMLEPKIGKVTYASWRNKFNFGWHDNWLMGIDGDKTATTVDWNGSLQDLMQERRTTIQSRRSQGDLFYQFFLGDMCHGEQCEKNCRFKYRKSSADIRIGDLWGKAYKHNEDGVSAVVVYTEKGLDLLKDLDRCALIEHPFETVAEGQMKKNAKKRELYGVTMKLLKKGYKLDGIVFKSVFLLQRIITKVRSIIKL